ncbi:MAG: serine/threonine-protein kinase [Proteobacteria bacterium]|nr:serine/threonine-protein kinase [Pseudomonadota bacterium]
MSMALVGAGAGGAGLGLILVVVGLLSGRRKTGLAPTGQALAPTMTSEGYPGASTAATPAPGYLPTGMSATSPALSIAGGSLAGQQIGRWQIIRILGSGGMADVFLAHARGEAGFEKQVALKVMHSHLARNERAVAHFLDEARLAARVQHPNVVQIHDLGKIGDDYVIVMDYVDGVDLERLLASARAGGRPVPIEVALGIMCRICDGLHAAHTAIAPDDTKLGIIHRDVKSANVLVSKQGAVKVVDFGIAKAATQVHHTVAGETKGTPSMMAPEQRIGEAVDVRVDVYAVAAVAYEILTGHGVNLDLAALAHLGIENWPHLPIPSSLRPELPHELDAILLGAMSYEREKRPANCETFEATFLAVMKAHHLSCSDKDIMRWVESEIALLGAAESARLAVAT